MAGSFPLSRARGPTLAAALDKSVKRVLWLSWIYGKILISEKNRNEIKKDAGLRKNKIIIVIRGGITMQNVFSSNDVRPLVEYRGVGNRLIIYLPRAG